MYTPNILTLAALLVSVTAQGLYAPGSGGSSAILAEQKRPKSTSENSTLKRITFYEKPNCVDEITMYNLAAATQKKAWPITRDVIKRVASVRITTDIDVAFSSAYTEDDLPDDWRDYSLTDSPMIEDGHVLLTTQLTEAGHDEWGNCWNERPGEGNARPLSGAMYYAFANVES